MSVNESIRRTREELEELVVSRRGRLVRRAQAILGDREEAEDVVQETLLGIWRQAGRRDIRELGAYAARAVEWNALKRRARRPSEIPWDSLPPSRISTAVDESRLDALELERALARLPVAQQTVLRLRFYLGLTFQEIAKNLSVSLDTAASRSRYALANLRRALQPPPGER